jgi:hypothetical protein
MSEISETELFDASWSWLLPHNFGLLQLDAPRTSLVREMQY